MTLIQSSCISALLALWPFVRIVGTDGTEVDHPERPAQEFSAALLDLRLLVSHESRASVGVQVMFIPKEVCQNILMGFAPVRSFAERRHVTGQGSDAGKVANTVQWLESACPPSLAQLEVLEVGPGRGRAGVVGIAPKAGAYAAVDVRPYLDAKELALVGVDYRVTRDGVFPWESGSFDLVWSRSVLEHVNDPDAVVGEMIRVLRGNGRLVAEVDLEDHYCDRKEADGVFSFLRYSERTWNAMTSNRSAYCNRLRMSDWKRLFEGKGLVIDSFEVEPPYPSLEQLRDVPYLRGVSDEDLQAGTIRVVARAAF